MRGFDVAFAELRREAFKQPDLVLLQFDLAFAGGLLRLSKRFVLGEQVVALPDAPDAARGYGNAP
jgi:hypothetical protein